MKIIHDIREWQTLRASYPKNQSIGFVPTMGALHQAHMSLITESQRHNDLTIVSIFINPTQFNCSNDFTHYPRTLENDFELLSQAKVDVCIVPDAAVIYKDTYEFQVTRNQNDPIMEAKFRPGHFTGVLTVVMKLLHLVQPTSAYFGEKDYQQFQMIRDMVDAFFMNVEICPCPTLREPSGLPFSSRNQRLTTADRILADQFIEHFHQAIPLNEIEEKIKALGIHIDYIESHQNRRFAAVRIGQVRLIDNYAI